MEYKIIDNLDLGTTNFVYKIHGKVTQADVDEINGIDSKQGKIRKRMEMMKTKGYSLEFNTISSDMFHSNLIVIDSKLPEILSELILYYFTGKGNKLSDLLELITTVNPCHYNDSLDHNFYEYKVKSFLRDVALGMTPAKKWDGHFDATGGYIIVKEDGEIVCYHIYNQNEFQEYLLRHTKFDSPGTKRHGYGVIYEHNGEYFFNLNFQIRFI